MQHTRIDIGRLTRHVLFTLVLPVFAAGSLDIALGTYPTILAVVSVICIPLATFLVIRTALAELDSLFRHIAPEPSEPEDAAVAQVGDTAPTAQ